jgi:putative endonuclease
MFYTYILYSVKIDRYYIGFSKNPEKRLKERHNKGTVKATKVGIPYELLVKKGFVKKEDAKKEELRLKKKKSRTYLEYLIERNW